MFDRRTVRKGNCQREGFSAGGIFRKGIIREGNYNIILHGDC